MSAPVNGADERGLFEAAMAEAGYPKPERGPFADSQYLHQRDEDRFVGWQLARVSLGAEQVLAREDGYTAAFYELVALMGISAQPISPERVWREQMLPRLRTALASAAQVSAEQEPFAYYIYIEAEQRGELVHDLEDAMDDLTNCECEITELFERSSAGAAQKSAGETVIWKDVDGQMCVCTDVAQVPSPWQPIETAPKDGQIVLYWVASYRSEEDEENGCLRKVDVSAVDMGCWMANAGHGYHDPFGGIPGDQGGVTHWMPLPLPPAAALSQQGDAK